MHSFTHFEGTLHDEANAPPPNRAPQLDAVRNKRVAPSYRRPQQHRDGDQYIGATRMYICCYVHKYVLTLVQGTVTKYEYA
jgi:hypothetical protein